MSKKKIYPKLPKFFNKKGNGDIYGGFCKGSFEGCEFPKPQKLEKEIYEMQPEKKFNETSSTEQRLAGKYFVN